MSKQGSRQFSDDANPMQQMFNVISTLFSQSLKTARKANERSQIETKDKNYTNNNQESEDNEATTVEYTEGRNNSVI